MLNERSQAQKVTYCMTAFNQRRQVLETESRQGDDYCMGIGFPFAVMKVF
jgi:hypothetical protein